MRSSRNMKILSSVLLFLFMGLQDVFAQQIITDGKTNTSLTINGNITDVSTRTIKGNNAFNSFSRFNVNQGKIVNLVVPSNSTNLINIVHSETSIINGILNSLKNGKIGGNIYLVNPNGIIIGSSGIINVGSLNAVTPTKEFTKRFFDSKGNINDWEVYQLISGNAPVNNNAVVNIAGKVNAINNINIASGTIVNTGKLNSGVSFSDMVNVDTMEDGSAITKTKGKIVISAAKDVIESGEIVADGYNNLDAGSIIITAENNIDIQSTALISARGRGVKSDGGNIYIYSNNNATFNNGGVINASGGNVSGNGGFIELSANNNVILDGGVFKAGAVNGRAGTVIIDPKTIEISSNQYSDGANMLFDATESITVNNNVTISSRNLNDVYTEDHLTAPSMGNSGTIIFSTKNISLGEAKILASADNNYSSGNIIFDTKDKLTVEGTTIKTNGILYLPSGNIKKEGIVFNPNEIIAGRLVSDFLSPNKPLNLSSNNESILIGNLDHITVGGELLNPASITINSKKGTAVLAGDVSTAGNITLSSASHAADRSYIDSDANIKAGGNINIINTGSSPGNSSINPVIRSNATVSAGGDINIDYNNSNIIIETDSKLEASGTINLTTSKTATINGILQAGVSNSDLVINSEGIIAPESNISATISDGTVNVSSINGQDSNININAATVNGTGTIKLASSSDVNIINNSGYDLSLSDIGVINSGKLFINDVPITTDYGGISVLTNSSDNANINIVSAPGTNIILKGIINNSPGTVNINNIDGGIIAMSTAKVEAVDIEFAADNIDLNTGSSLYGSNSINLAGQTVNIDGMLKAGSSVVTDYLLLVNADNSVDPASNIGYVIQDNNILVDNLDNTSACIDITGAVTGNGQIDLPDNYGNINIINNSDNNLVVNNLNTSSAGTLTINDYTITENYGNITVNIGDTNPNHVDIANNTASSVILQGNILNNNGDIKVTNTLGEINAVENINLSGNNIDLHSSKIVINPDVNLISEINTTIDPVDKLEIKGGKIVSGGILTINKGDVYTNGIAFNPISIHTGSLSGNFIVMNGPINIDTISSASIGNLDNIIVNNSEFIASEIKINAVENINITGNNTSSGTVLLNSIGSNISINGNITAEEKIAINSPENVIINGSLTSLANDRYYLIVNPDISVDPISNIPCVIDSSTITTGDVNSKPGGYIVINGNLSGNVELNAYNSSSTIDIINKSDFNVVLNNLSVDSNDSNSIIINGNPINESLDNISININGTKEEYIHVLNESNSDILLSGILVTGNSNIDITNTGGNILVSNNSSYTRANNINLIALSGSIGSSETPVNIDLQSGEINATANGIINLSEIAGNMNIGSIISSGDVIINSDNSILELIEDNISPELDIKGNNIILNALNGNIGDNLNIIEIDSNSENNSQLTAIAQNGNIYLGETGVEPVIIVNKVIAKDEIYLRADWKIQNYSSSAESAIISTTAENSKITLVTDDTKLYDEATGQSGTIKTGASGITGIVEFGRETNGDIYAAYADPDDITHPEAGQTTHITNLELGTIQTGAIMLKPSQGVGIWGNAPGQNVIIDDNYDFLNHPVDVGDGTVYIARKTDGVLILGHYTEGIGVITQSEIDNITADNISFGNVLNPAVYTYGDTTGIILYYPDFSKTSSTNAASNVTLKTSGSILDGDIDPDNAGSNTIIARDLTLIAGINKDGSNSNKGTIGAIGDGDIDIYTINSGILNAKAPDDIFIQKPHIALNSNNVLYLDTVESTQGSVNLTMGGNYFNYRLQEPNQIIDINGDKANIVAANNIDVKSQYSYYFGEKRYLGNLGDSADFIETNVDSNNDGAGSIFAESYYIYINEIAGNLNLRRAAMNGKQCAEVYLLASDSNGADIIDATNSQVTSTVYNISSLKTVLETPYGSIGSGSLLDNGAIDISWDTRLYAYAGTASGYNQHETINIEGRNILTLVDLKTNANSDVNIYSTNSIVGPSLNPPTSPNIITGNINLLSDYYIGDDDFAGVKPLGIKLLNDGTFTARSKCSIIAYSFGDFRLNEAVLTSTNSIADVVLVALDNGSILDTNNTANPSYNNIYTTSSVATLSITMNADNIGSIDKPVKVLMHSDVLKTSSSGNTYVVNNDTNSFMSVGDSISGGIYSLNANNIIKVTSLIGNNKIDITTPKDIQVTKINSMGNTTLNSTTGSITLGSVINTGSSDLTLNAPSGNIINDIYFESMNIIGNNITLISSPDGTIGSLACPMTIDANGNVIIQGATPENTYINYY